MGNLVNPISSRLGYVKYWDSLWVSGSKTNYSPLLNLDILVKLYVEKLLKKVAKNVKTRGDPKITSFKVFMNFDAIYFMMYFWVDEFVEDAEAADELFMDIANRFSYVKARKYVSRFKKSTSKKPISNKKIDNPRYLRRQSYYVRQYKGKIKKPTSKKLMSTNKKGTLTFTKPNLFSHLQSVFELDMFKELRKVSKYDAYRKQKVPFAPLFKNSNLIKRQLMVSSKKVSLLRIQAKKLSVVLKGLRLLILYKSKLQALNFFIQYCVQKYVGNTRVAKIIFVRHTPNLLTASLLADYVIGRLKVNFPVRPLVNTFIRNMRFQMHAGTILGFKIVCSGRFARRGRASYAWRSIGKIANTNFELELDYALKLVTLTNSICAVKIWLVRPSQNEKIIVL